MKLAVKLLLISLIACYSCSASALLCIITNMHSSLDNTTWSFNSNPSPGLVINVSRGDITDACQYFLTFSAGGSGSYSQRLLYNSTYTIPYQVYKEVGHVNVLKAFPSINNSNDVIEGSFPLLSGPLTNHHTYYPLLGTVGEYPRFGTYSDTITISLYRDTIIPPYTFVDSHTVTYSYTVGKLIDLSLVNTGAPFDIASVTHTMNFGTMSVGTNRAFDVVLKYNAGYSLKFSSANNGQMKHASLNSYVSYDMTVNGNPINLSGSSGSPVEVSTATGVSSSEGLRLPVSATISSLGTAAAGSYSDTINITVTSIE